MIEPPYNIDAEGHLVPREISLKEACELAQSVMDKAEAARADFVAAEARVFAESTALEMLGERIETLEHAMVTVNRRVSDLEAALVAIGQAGDE